MSKICFEMGEINILKVKHSYFFLVRKILTVELHLIKKKVHDSRLWKLLLFQINMFFQCAVSTFSLRIANGSIFILYFVSYVVLYELLCLCLFDSFN